ncbi:hypothetical protein LJC06_04280 [Bacteroidales bacterium OttesenSCG-928-I14]|nr:hypothetical protein [Bacteroidales bacterium OttesenSCG-928-I14]
MKEAKLYLIMILIFAINSSHAQIANRLDLFPNHDYNNSLPNIYMDSITCSSINSNPIFGIPSMDFCPMCGNTDYSGNTCSFCGYGGDSGRGIGVRYYKLYICDGLTIIISYCLFYIIILYLCALKIKGK